MSSTSRDATAGSGGQNTGRGVGVHFGGDLQRALLDAGRDELAAVGPDRLSLRGVARRAGVSHAAPAHHFGGKTGLLTALAAEGFASLHAALADAVGRADDPREQLGALGAAYADFAADHPGEFELMFRQSLIDTDDPRYREASAASYDVLRTQVERLQGSGWRESTPSDELTTATWALVHGLSTLRIHGALQPNAQGLTTSDLVRIATAVLD